MSRREDRGYKVVYRKAEKESTRESTEPERKERRRRASSPERRGTYSRGEDVVLVERPRGSVTRYEIPKESRKPRRGSSSKEKPEAKPSSRRQKEYEPIIVEEASSDSESHTEPVRRKRTAPEKKRSPSPSSESDDYRRPEDRRPRIVEVKPANARSPVRKSRRESPVRSRKLRARSVSVSRKDVEGHEAGDQLHELPGAEARTAGKYLKREKSSSKGTRSRKSSTSDRTPLVIERRPGASSGVIRPAERSRRSSTRPSEPEDPPPAYEEAIPTSQPAASGRRMRRHSTQQSERQQQPPPPPPPPQQQQPIYQPPMQYQQPVAYPPPQGYPVPYGQPIQYVQAPQRGGGGGFLSKLGNAALFGAGFTGGADLVNAII